MRDGNIAVNVVSEDDNELVIQTTEGTKETYYVNPIRSMRLFIQELQVSCGASNLTFGMPGPLPAPQLGIHGKAWLEGGSISVIGEPTNKSRSFTISFKAYDEADVAKHEEGKVLHTVSLGFVRRDWEIGSDDEWFIECYVAPAMIEAISEAISAGTVQELTVALSLEGIYSDDKWSPPAVSADWFLRPSRLDNSLQCPEMAHGGVMRMNLGLAKVDLRPKPEPQPDEPDLDELEQMHADALVPNEQLAAIRSVGSNIEKLTATVKTAGWAIALGLLFLVLR